VIEEDLAYKYGRKRTSQANNDIKNNEPLSDFSKK
jgi:hypothetical protein